MLEIILLSIIQGITEFLPVSSSAHLIVVSKFFNFNNSNLNLDLSLHLGSLLAILFYFNNDMKNFVDNKILFKKIVLTSIPISIVGFLLIKFNYIDQLRTFKLIGWSTVLFGIILYISDFKEVSKTMSKSFTYKSTLIISLFQVLALIPGVSRSGIIITGGRLLGYDRIDSAKISFYTSIPILIIASMYNAKELLLLNNFKFSFININGMVLSFIFSYITIKFFLNFLKNFSLAVFAIYRVIIGLIILFYVY